MSNSIKFGTDGWRGIIARDFTFDNVQLCTQAAADYLKETGLARRGVVIGYDNRFASEDFAAAAAEVLAGNKIKVYLCPQATPTPAVSFGVVTQKAGGAIIITASHNPARWNGFKFKSELGSSASPETTATLEANIDRIQASGKIDRLSLSQAVKQNLVEYLDLAPIYRRQLGKLVNLSEIGRARLKVAVDPMYGVGAGYFPELLGSGAIELYEINSERNPLFPGMRQPEPIADNLTRLADAVRSGQADVGLATDGDADRLGVIDENGKYISTLHVFALLCLYLLEVRGERGPLIKTITMSRMLYRLGELFNVPVYETPVGFKHIAPLMISQQALAGGEESGGYGFANHVPERDGVLSGLYFLDFMIKTGKSPTQLIEYLHSKVGPHYYKRVDLTVSEADYPAITDRVKSFSPASLDGVKVASADASDGYRFILADDSWLLIRFSKTEPLLRIYAESGRETRVASLIELAHDLIKA